MRKLTFLLLVLPFVALGIAACDSTQNLVGPAGAEQAFPESGTDGSAGRMSADRQLDHQMVHFASVASFAPMTQNLIFCDLPPDYSGDPVAFPVDSAGSGESSFMGEIEIYIVFDYCQVTPVGVLGGGRFVDTDNNGDTVSGIWDAIFMPPVFVFIRNGKAQPLIIEDGTGSYAGTTGFARGGGTIDPETGSGSYVVRGMVNLAGSPD